MSYEKVGEWELIQKFGDTVAEVINQMLIGHWVDDHGHPVSKNTAMINLCDALKLATQWRDEQRDSAGGQA